VQSQDALDQYTVDFSSAATGSLTVNVPTTANTAAAASSKRTPILASFLGGTFLFLIPVLMPVRKRAINAALLCVALVLMLGLLPSCGGSSGGSTTTTGGGNGTTPGNYSVTVNAFTVSNTSGNPDTTLSILLTVN
jgi:hypothetical protein